MDMEHAGKASKVYGREMRWYIAECKPTKERTLRSTLESEGYAVYVASQREERVYASRNRRMVEKVVIPGKVFIKTSEAEIWNILSSNLAIHRFMVNRAASDRERGKRVYASVPDVEMEQLRYVLNNAPNPVRFSTEDLIVGQQIEVTRGPLCGLRGVLSMIENVSYIVLRMEMGEHNCVFTEISVQDVKPV